MEAPDTFRIAPSLDGGCPRSWVCGLGSKQGAGTVRLARRGYSRASQSKYALLTQALTRWCAIAKGGGKYNRCASLLPSPPAGGNTQPRRDTHMQLRHCLDAIEVRAPGRHRGSGAARLQRGSPPAGCWRERRAAPRGCTTSLPSSGGTGAATALSALASKLR